MKVLALALSLFALAAPAFAQKHDAATRHEIRARASDEVTVRLATAIGLDAAATAKFKAVIQKHAPLVEAQEQAIAKAKQQLRQLVASRTNDATALNQATDAFFAAVKQYTAAKDARDIEVRSVLTPAQFAMGVLETPRILREVKKELMNAAGHGEED